MYKKDLDLLLKKDKLPRVYLLYGDDFFVAHYGVMISKQFALKSDSEIQKIYFDEFKIGELIELFEQVSLFGGDRIVLLRLDIKLDKKSCTRLINAINHNKSACLVIEFIQSSSKSNTEYQRDCKDFVKNLTNKDLTSLFVPVRFFAPNDRESLAILSQKADELGIVFDTYSLQYILDLQNKNLAIALKEIEKFALYATSTQNLSLSDSITKDSRNITDSITQRFHIRDDEVRFLVDGIASFGVDELIHALISKGSKDFIKILDGIYAEGMSEVVLVNEITSIFYRLFLFFAYIKLHGKLDANEILGYTPPTQVLATQQQYCMSFKEEQYLRVFDILNEWNVQSKQGVLKNQISPLIKIQEILR